MVMSAPGGGAELRERLPALWRAIEHCHYVYLETDDSPEKITQRNKLEGYIMEYLTLVPHECKFGLPETAKVFQRTITDTDLSAYRAGLGWAALAQYAENILTQPWRTEYRTIRLYCGYYKHEVEANMLGAETILHAMGYKPCGNGKLSLIAPVCPDMVAAVSRDAIIAHVECKIMSLIWEGVWNGGGRVTWSGIARERSARVGDVSAAVGNLLAAAAGVARVDGAEIYANIQPMIPTIASQQNHQPAVQVPDTRHYPHPHPRPLPTCNHICPEETLVEEPILPMVHPPYMVAPNMMYPINEVPHNPVQMVTPYGVPYYYPGPYMMPAQVYAPIKHAMNVPVNGYPPVQYRYPAVPTGQLIELDACENGRCDRYREEPERHKRSIRHVESSRRNSTSKSGFSDVTLPSLPRSDTQPALSKAKEDGMGTYESWDYVFRNLSSKDQDRESRVSPSLERDSRTLERLHKEERRSKYQPATLDLEDGLQALNLDRSYDDEVYRTAKVNENLMRLKQEQEHKKAKQLAKRQVSEERKKKSSENVEVLIADGLLINKIAPDRIKLLTKKDVKDRKEVLKAQNSFSGTTSTSEIKKVKSKIKSMVDGEKPKSKSMENGYHGSGHSSRNVASSSNHTQPQSYDLKTHLVVSLDEADSRPSPPRQIQNGGDHQPIRNEHPKGDYQSRITQPQNVEMTNSGDKKDKWECGTCTYLNSSNMVACEMCGKSKKGPEIQPLTSGGRECPTCTLVNGREAKICDACGSSLDHCPTYI